MTDNIQYFSSVDGSGIDAVCNGKNYWSDYICTDWYG